MSTKLLVMGCRCSLGFLKRLRIAVTAVVLIKRKFNLSANFDARGWNMSMPKVVDGGFCVISYLVKQEQLCFAASGGHVFNAS